MKYKILWVDDEVDLLKPHILFLENKGYEIVPVISGADALEEIDNSSIFIIFKNNYNYKLENLSLTFPQLKN